MLPEPSEVYKQTSESDSSLPPPPSTQHGYDLQPRDDLPADHGGYQPEHQRPTRTPPGSTTGRSDASPTRIGSDTADAEGSLSRLKKSQTPSTPPRNRIDEYERAVSASPISGSSGMRIEVLKQPRKPGDKSCPIAKLPNEVLTHVLSHLPPIDLSNVSLVCRRFHDLVTAPHAWRVGFARFFPGHYSLVTTTDVGPDHDDEDLRTEKRAFTRLTAIPSWRSEYLLRTRLLRSLSRGKPLVDTTKQVRPGVNPTASPVTMYDSRLLTTVTRLHATFNNGPQKNMPRFVHGEDEMGTASSSDPAIGRTDNWGSADPHLSGQFIDLFPGEAQWGLGRGDIIGNPNVMEVSQVNGIVNGEGRPGGLLYFRAPDEMRGRHLLLPVGLSDPELGIPFTMATDQSICSVWIAKSRALPSLSDGTIGILSGSSQGIVSAYSMGTDGLRDRRLGRGELTARWVLSPGIPIIAIAVDEQYSIKRHAQNRIWAVVLNALGELFYLTKFPKRPGIDRGARIDEAGIEELAWATGRSVYWNLVETSRREGRPDPYNASEADGSYSPRSSWSGMCLSKDQIVSETSEINVFLKKKPRDFQKSCLGWDMRRKMEVDFAGDDGKYAGESIVVFQCALDEEGGIAEAKRFTRCKFLETDNSAESEAETRPELSASSSLFGGAAQTQDDQPSQPLENLPPRRSSVTPSNASDESRMAQEWRLSHIRMGDLRFVQITATTIDSSIYATLSMSEDPALSFSSASQASSPYASPVSSSDRVASPSDIPGQRARFIAAGTTSGSIILWDIRAPVASSISVPNDIHPIRIIHTDSPQISCLGLTSLYLVSGGNDGLVQMWDPLASSLQPIRTLNSRFSSRARRRLAQAEAGPHGVGINLFAAGAIALDPDPTVLRGMVSLGTHLRYWAYSASAADAYKSSKRRLRRSSGRGGNTSGGFVAGKAGLRDYIAQERFELDRDRRLRQKERERLAGRFGVDLLGEDASEEQMLQYAALLSEESLREERKRRTESTSAASSSPPLPVLDEDVLAEASASGSSSAFYASSDSSTPIPSELAEARDSPQLKSDSELDADIAEAIQLSMQNSPRPQADEDADEPFPARPNWPPRRSTSSFEGEIKQVKAKRSPPSSRRSPAMGASAGGSGTGPQSQIDEDLAYALKLSAEQEEETKAAQEQEEFPALSPSKGSDKKGGNGSGKGEGRAAW